MKRHIHLLKLGGLLSLSCVLNAATFKVTPVNLGNGYKLTGTIDTDDTIGLLTAANFKSWSITVTQTTDLIFDETNTISGNISQVSTDGKRLRVPTSPDGFTDGGYFVFTGPARRGEIPTSALVADFTGPNIAGGVAGWQTPLALNYVYLNQPNGTNYTAAVAAKGKPNVFNLVPVVISTSPTILTMRGTVTTDGTIGPLTHANFISWHIVGREEDIQTYSPANSQIMNAVEVFSDNITLKMNKPAGILQIGMPSRRPIIVTIADFTDPTHPNGLASYYYGWNGLVAMRTGLSKDPTYVVAAE